MEFDANRSGKQLLITSAQVMKGLGYIIQRWRLRRQTRRILAALTEAQLKDIGLSRHDWN